MKFNFLETFEEKFYFKTSHIFWHLLTGLAGLALLAGIIILLWSLTPSFRPGVKKPVYPEPVKVTAEEIKLRIQPPAKARVIVPTPVETVQPSPTEVKPIAPTTEDPAEKAYLAAMDSLRLLLPPEKFKWETRGHWEESWYERRWVVDYYGISDRLKSVFNNLDADNFKLKQQLLSAYLKLISLFPEDQRLTVFRAAIDYSKEDVPTSVANIELLRATVPNFNVYNSDFVADLATFGRKNPRDGRAFINYVNTIMPKFDRDIRPQILSNMISSYYNHFNLIERQQEATDLFLAMQASFTTEEQPKALVEYYRTFVGKNYERESQIKELDNQYQRKLEDAESVLAHKKAVKSKYRLNGLKVIGGSIVFIAFLALFLVVLSIQRNVKLLREEMAAK